VTTLAESLELATARLTTAGLAPSEARQSAWVLAGHVLGQDRASLVAMLRDELPAGFASAFDAAAARRASREPVAYITGRREFYGRPFIVTRDVLIPRPETELVVDESLACVRSLNGAPGLAIIDVGTGTGCLATTLALELGAAHVVATDTSAAALDVARANAAALGAADRVHFTRGSLVAGTAGPVDLVVSNPPYISDGDRRRLDPEVGVFEPAGALFAGPDGLDVIRALAPEAARVLRPGGWLVMEIGDGQADAVRHVIAGTGLLTVERIQPDLQHIPRVVVARRHARKSS
jgi:release factor glutamine methyltransferase